MERLFFHHKLLSILKGTANFDEEGLDKLGTLVYCLHFFKTFFKILEIYITNMSVEYFV